MAQTMSAGLPRSSSAMPFVMVGFGIATFSLMDAVMKSASIAVGPYNAMLYRSIIGMMLMFPLWLAGGGRWPDMAALKLHALRGALSAGLATAFFWGLVRLPLAEAIAISFVAPLIALFLAAGMLGEQIGRTAVMASLFGLGGVLLIGAARFGDSAYGDDALWGIAAILLSAVLYAFNLIYQRRQAQIASPQEVALFQTVFVGLFLGAFAPFWMIIPAPGELATIGIGALLAMVSLMVISWGYGRAEAQVLIPIEYTAFLWAALFGWMLFEESITATTVAGAALIVAGCWMAAQRGRPN